MPEKSIREMNKYERMHYSLASRTFHATLMGSIILGLAALIVGLGLYVYALGRQYVGTAFNLASNANMILGKVVDVEPLADEVMERYRGLTEEQRQEVGTEKYRGYFSNLESSETYNTSVSILKDFLDSSDVYDIYLAMYDRDTEAIVYFADPDMSDARLYPGDWEHTRLKGIDKFLNWDGEGHLYDIAKTDNYGWLATSGVPVKNAEGETVAFVLADITLSSVVKGAGSFMLQFFIATTIVTLLIAFLMTRRIKKTLVKPINEIAGAAESYINDKRNGTLGTAHFSNLKVSTGDEIENLALLMADMEKDLGEYEADLTRVTAEKERIGTELELARRIQADMLPNIYPAFPDRPEFDIYATMTPAKEVGGDFYDFFLIDKTHLGIVMADVSGKGVPAALFMMVSKILVKNHAMAGKSPAQVLSAVNEQICANNREEMFVTVWFGVLDLESGVLTAANAGHEYPVVKTPGGQFELLRDRHGFVIGGMSGMKYKEYEIKLEPGAKLFVYTDGVAEAVDLENRQFGTDRMLKAINSKASGTVYEVLGELTDALEDFTCGADQFDDVTMLCLDYFGLGECDNAAEAEAAPMESRTFEAKVENIPAVTDFVDCLLDELGCPIKAKLQIDVAIDEIFSNIASYAYPSGGGTAEISVTPAEKPKGAVITFSDSGIPYDPTERDDPDVTLGAEERGIGGLGIFLVKKTMDKVVYEYKDGRNILRVRKNF